MHLAKQEQVSPQWTPSQSSRWGTGLCRREHVHNISAKATRVLNFIRHNIYRCTPEVKALAYTSLIRPHLEYASSWDPYTTRDSHQLDKVQRRTARFVKRNYRQTASVSELISELRWQSLEDRRKNARMSVLQGSAWSGSYPREWTPTSYKVYSILWNWYIYCYVIQHRCL